MSSRFVPRGRRFDCWPDAFTSRYGATPARILFLVVGRAAPDICRAARHPLLTGIALGELNVDRLLAYGR